MELTEKEYWEKFWDSVSVPAKVDLTFSNDFNIANILDKFLVADSKKKAFEVGCAPGKWLIYLSERFNYSVDGCEYIEIASKKTTENLKVCGVNGFNIFTGDFLKMDFDTKYDVVISLGFIEHFEDASSVCKKHAKLLKKDGLLIIGVPKLTGLNYYIAKQVDKSITDKLIPNHNLSTMNLDFFEGIGNITNCKNLFVGTVGGFEPALFDTSKSPIWFKIMFHSISLILNNRLLKSINDRCCSSYIMGVYQKND
jgi:2-polyprenyl-3-methyl-5-hydroxy-6-metoxy-1,4-benzoquinol methylase